MNTVKLSKLLLKDGFEITLFTKKDSTILTFARHEFHNVELVEKKRKYFDFKTAKRVAKLLKAANIKVVFAVDNKDLDVLAWTKRFFYPELKIVYQQHMQIGISKKDLIHTIRYKSIDTWICPLPFLKLEVGLQTLFPLNRVETIPIGVDIDRFKIPKYSKIQARQKLNIPADVQLVGIIGRISEKKGQLFIAQSILKLRNIGRDLHLLIFGSATVNDEKDQQYAFDLKRFVDENNLSNCIHFIDYQENVWQFYNSIDIFVLASHSETFGMVTVEAMLSGIPIIATNSGGTPEILENAKLGYLYNYEDLNNFCKVFIELIENEEETKQKVKEAKEVAILTYNQEVEMKSIAKVLRSHL